MGGKHTKTKATGGGNLKGGAVVRQRAWDEKKDRETGLLIRNFTENRIPGIIADLERNGELSQLLERSFGFIVNEKVRLMKEDARELILSIVTLAREMNEALTRLEEQQKAKATEPHFITLEMTYAIQQENFPLYFEKMGQLNAVYSLFTDYIVGEKQGGPRRSARKNIEELASEFGRRLGLDVSDLSQSDIGALYYLSTVPSMQLSFDFVRAVSDASLHHLWAQNKATLVKELKEVNTLEACIEPEAGAGAGAGPHQPGHQQGHEPDASRYKLNDYIATIIYTVANMPEVLMKSHLNVMLTGPAGAGKTRFAKIIGNILKACGLLLARKSIDVVSRPDLVGQYIGQSAPRTKARLISNVENVLFIDEAYMVAQRDNNDGWDPYSSEVIGELVNFLDKTKGRICVIAAGYHENMHDTFMKINEGMPRRFPFQIALASFTPEELVQLLCYFLRKQYGIRNALDGSAISYMTDTVRDNMNTLFKNSAGDMENLAGIAAARLGILKMADRTKRSLNGNDFKIILKSYCEQTKGVRCFDESEPPEEEVGAAERQQAGAVAAAPEKEQAAKRAAARAAVIQRRQSRAAEAEAEARAAEALQTEREEALMKRGAALIAKRAAATQRLRILEAAAAQPAPAAMAFLTSLSSLGSSPSPKRPRT